MMTPRSRILVKSLVMASTLWAGAQATTASAHGIWFAQRARQIALIFGLGSDDLDMVRRLPRLTSFAAYDADGKPVQAQLVAKGAIPLIEATAPYAYAAATMDYGTWTKRPDGEFDETTKDKVVNAVLGERTYKYTIFLAKPLAKPLPLIAGHRLQIVPVAKDIPQEMGKTIAVKVSVDG